MGFANHGGMWSDLVLLSMANAAVVPHLAAGRWLIAALAAATVASLGVHAYWYRPYTSASRNTASSDGSGGERNQNRGDHMWPRPKSGSWWRDLSWAGWAHVIYVVGELTLLAGFLVHPVPIDTVILVAAIFTIHLPIGLLQPRWFRTGHVATIAEQPLLAPLLVALWAVTFVKLG